MSLKMVDRVRETSDTGGTGTLNLGGALTGYIPFSTGVGNGNSCPYLVDDGLGNWELTWGVVVTGVPNTITRGTLINSSTGSRINFNAVTKTVAVVSAAELILWSAASPVLAETDIASATTTDLGSLTTLRARITGTTTITGFGSQPNAWRIVRFAGVLTLTHNATSLILLLGLNRTTVAGAIGWYESDASGNWREMYYWEPPGQIPGTATNDDAAPGKVGEILRATLSSGTIADATYTSLGFVDLTPGDWDVSGAIALQSSGGGAAAEMLGWIGSGGASFPGFTEYHGFYVPYVIGAGFNGAQTIAQKRYTVASGTTRLHLYAYIDITAGSFNKFGWIEARRVR